MLLFYLKGKDMKEYSSQDYFDLDDHYQRLCNQQKEFVIWEGPLEGRRVSERRIFFVSNEWLTLHYVFNKFDFILRYPFYYSFERNL